MPTSAEFDWIPLNMIKVPEERGRKEYKDIDNLAASISKNGLINPVVLDRDLNLVAGGRRLKAIQLLLEPICPYHWPPHWPKPEEQLIPLQWADQLETGELLLIEIEENLKRVDLTWKEHVTEVRRYHDLRKEHDQDWEVENTATAINIAPRTVYRALQLADALADGDEQVSSAETIGTAYGILQRRHQRAVDSELALLDPGSEDILAALDQGDLTQEIDREEPDFTGLDLDDLDVPGIDEEEVELREPREHVERPLIRGRLVDKFILQASFLEWAKEEKGIKYNLIHCDFPYGINHSNSAQGAAATRGAYEDSEDIFFDLLWCLINNKDNFMLENAHILFWYSFKFYRQIHEAFTENGFTVWPEPFIWYKNDNTGIVRDAARGPRHVYEPCLFITRGDRPIVRTISNVIPHPANKREAQHVSEKPLPMLRTIYRMLVDKSTYLLDPTCGGGTSLAAALMLENPAESCPQVITGLDIDEEYVSLARSNVRAAMYHL